MVRLSKAVSKVLIGEFGQEEFLRRLSDPFWFQSLGCVIGFDWHSSGLSTTTLGALKEALNGENLGIQFAGGKGRASRKALEEIRDTPFSLSDKKIERLIYSSRMSAKVDSALLQDNYGLYHHSFAFDEKGSWVAVQQGMNESNGYARRYHWISDSVKDFVVEPQSAICCDSKSEALNMAAGLNDEARKCSVDLVTDNPAHLKKYLNRKIPVENKTTNGNNFGDNQIIGAKKGFIQHTLGDFTSQTKEFVMPRRHLIINMGGRDFEMLNKAYEVQPGTYEELAAIKGVGAKTIRSLALISSLIYGSELSWKDPAKYSFAHGGKDKVPYEIDRRHYDASIEVMNNAIKDAKLGSKDKIKALRRLKKVYA